MKLTHTALFLMLCILTLSFQSCTKDCEDPAPLEKQAELKLQYDQTTVYEEDEENSFQAIFRVYVILNAGEKDIFFPEEMEEHFSEMFEVVTDQPIPIEIQDVTFEPESSRGNFLEVEGFTDEWYWLEPNKSDVMEITVRINGQLYIEKATIQLKMKSFIYSSDRVAMDKKISLEDPILTQPEEVNIN